MRCLLLTVLLAAIAASLCARQPPPRIVLNYSFEPVVGDGKLALHVELEFKGGSTQTDPLVVPSAWGSATHLEKGITNLRNVQKADRVRISSELVNDWVVPPPRADHHALLEPEYFEFTTQTGLVHPPIESTSCPDGRVVAGAAQTGLVHPPIKSTTPVEVRFDWRKLPAG